jgi:acyl-coenzyme A thioesterase PaaI-like protein
MGSTPLDRHLFGPGQPCFGCSPEHPIGFRLEFARAGDTVTTTFVPGDNLQGPPGVMHGGLVMTLADELAVWTVLGLKERMTFTAAVEGRFARPVRIGKPVLGTGRIAKDGSRVLEVDVELAQDEQACFRASFKLAMLDKKGAERLIGPLPEAWSRFAR